MNLIEIYKPLFDEMAKLSGFNLPETPMEIIKTGDDMISHIKGAKGEWDKHSISYCKHIKHLESSLEALKESLETTQKKLNCASSVLLTALIGDGVTASTRAELNRISSAAGITVGTFKGEPYLKL